MNIKYNISNSSAQEAMNEAKLNWLNVEIQKNYALLRWFLIILVFFSDKERDYLF